MINFVYRLILLPKIFMKSRETIQFRNFQLKGRTPPVYRYSQHPHSQHPLYSDRSLKNLDAICEKIEQTLKNHNNKITMLEHHYQEAMLNRFDNLISVNQKVANNLQKLIIRLQMDQGRETNTLKVPSQLSKSKIVKDINSLTSLDFLKQQPSQEQIRKFTTKQKLSNNSPDKIANQGIVVKSSKNVIKESPQMFQSHNKNNNYLHLKNKTSSQMLQQRFTNIQNIFENILSYTCSEESVSQRINKFNGIFFNKAAEFYFQEYSMGRLRLDDMKIRFSTDIINEVIQVSEKWMKYVMSKNPQNLKGTLIKGHDFFRLFNQASLKSIQYLIHKYPPSRTKQIDTELSEKIKQIKSYSVVKYDLLRNAGMEFGFQNGQKNFSVQIKKWLNKLIIESRKEYGNFKKTMKEIFTNNEGSLDGTKTENEVEYNIGSKIPQNSQLYTQDEMKTPGLQIKSPQILRILIKWFEQLSSYFYNIQQKIFQNKFGFKTQKHKSIPLRIPHSRLQILSEKIKKIYANDIKPFKQEQIANIGKIIQALIGISFGGIEGYDFLDQRQATITKLSEHMYETFKSYIFIFLNGVLQSLVKIRSQYDANSSQSSINLITFNIMDILRCKCTGTKPQIYRIYNSIVDKKDYFQVIRVKNKLNQPTRDILLNLKLKNSFLICQVQLSLGQMQEQINDHFCHYLYELERSKFGVLFQCASQIANLDPRISYMKKQKKLKFREQSPITNRIWKFLSVKKDGVYCTIMHSQQKMEHFPSVYPYCCLSCNSFIEANRIRLPYLRCKLCGICLCTECIGKIDGKQSGIMSQIFQDKNFSKIPPKTFLVCSTFNYIGLYQPQKVKAAIISLLKTCEYVILWVVDKVKYNQTTYKKIRWDITESFSSILQIPELSVDLQSDRPLCAIVSVQMPVRKRISQLEGYMKYHISMDWSQLLQILSRRQIKEVVCVIDESIKSALIIDIPQTQEQIDKARIQKNINTSITNLNKTGGNYLQATSKNLRNIDFLSKISKKEMITTLNLWENQIRDIRILQEFQNLEQVYLNQNNLKSMTSLLGLKNLQLLGIGDNELQGELPVLKMPNLQSLTFYKNQISDISNLSKSQIPNLNSVNFMNNIITKLPKLTFQKLQFITVCNCRINDIEDFSKSQLPQLQSLILNNNLIQDLAVPFNFLDLQVLDLSRNKISSLGIFRSSELPKLKKLNLSENNISDGLCQLNLSALVEIDLNKNKISCLGGGLVQFDKLPIIQSINLRSNRINVKLPLLKLKTLKFIDLGQNQIDDVGNFFCSQIGSIEYIFLDRNLISRKLPEIGFKSLRVIDLSFNLIDDIRSLDKWRGCRIQCIKLNNNRICSLLPSMQLYGLSFIDLSNNNIREQNYLENIHLTPKINKIKIVNNTQTLALWISNKYATNKDLMKIVQF